MADSGEFPDRSDSPDAVDDLSEPKPPAQPFDALPAGSGFPWGLVLFLILAVIVVIFSVQNTQDVDLRFLNWSWELPVVVVIMVTVVVSVLLDEILGGLLKSRRRRRRAEMAELTRLRQKG